MAQWIKKGDKVLIIAGNDKGRSGDVLRRRGDKVVVQGVNVRKKHVKRRSEMQTPSIIEVEMPIHISNVALCDDEGVKIHVKVKVAQNQKELVYQKEDKEVSYRALKKS